MADEHFEIDDIDLPPPPGRQQSTPDRWAWLRFWDRGQQPKSTSEDPIKNELRTRRHLIESKLDALMLNHAVGEAYSDERYTYEAVKKRRRDLPLARWSREEKQQWEQRRRETNDIDYTLRRIPIDQDGEQATLIVKVYPAELEDRTRPREWSTGNIQLIFDGTAEESRGLGYSRIEGGIPQESILGKRKLKQGIVKTLGGTLEAWEEWLPAIDQLLEKSPVL